MRRWLIYLILVCHAVSSLQAHEGHDHGPTPGETSTATGPIRLTQEAIQNLGVQSIEANLAPLQRTLTMPARIEVLPEKHAQITARFEGRVKDILATLGQRVAQGQPLLKVDPLSIGNPTVVLRSPLNGFVMQQNLKLGQTFTAQSVLMEVADYTRVLAHGLTYENPHLSEIQIGQKAQVHASLLPHQTLIGTVQRIGIGLDSEAKTFEVSVLVDNQDLKLRPNTQATISIGLGEAQEVLAVPKQAILGDTGNYFVFVEQEKTFEKRPVVLGMKTADQIEILEGVLPGERVVTQGNYQLQYATSAPKEEIHAGHEEHGEHDHSTTKSGLSITTWVLLIGFAIIIGIVGFTVGRRR